jgi:hypothetical protein
MRTPNLLLTVGWLLIWCMMFQPIQATAQSLEEIAFPLGGIGTGCVSLGGRGELRDWEIFNGRCHTAPDALQTSCWVGTSLM